MHQRLRQLDPVDDLTDPRLAKTLAAYFTTLSTGDKAAWLSLFAAGAVTHNPVGTPPATGREGLDEIWNVLTAPFEQLSTEPDSVFYAGTGAAVQWTARGRSAAGGEVTFSGITVFEFSEDALIQTVMAYWDPAAMLIALADAEPGG